MSSYIHVLPTLKIHAWLQQCQMPAFLTCTSISSFLRGLKNRESRSEIFLVHFIFAFVCQAQYLIFRVLSEVQKLCNPFPPSFLGLQLPVFKVSSDVTELCGLRPDCCEKSCENTLRAPPVLGLGATLSLRALLKALTLTFGVLSRGFMVLPKQEHFQEKLQFV